MKKKNRKKHNNAGMSLVEIVVVVLIIGILSAGAVIGFSFINSRDASSAAENIMSTLERTKLDTLASKNSETVLLKLCKEDNHYYGIVMKDSTELDKIELAKNGVTITVKDTSGGQTVISDSTSYELKYNKSNGSFESAANEIVVSGANTVTVRLVTLTGRSYME